MANGWSGSDPTQANDTGSYSLGMTWRANVDILVPGLRVWAGASPGVLTGRHGRLWTSDEAQLAIATMPDSLPTNGWSAYDFGAPVTVPAGTICTVDYDTGGNYGELNAAFNADVVSADGAVTLLSGGTAPHGNGSFTTSVGAYPDRASSQNTFYGVDIVYSIVSSDNTAPTITAMTVTVDTSGATVTALIEATDAETLAGATYSFDWGDGSSTMGLSSPTATHTYSASGIYSVLGSVTDAGGLAAYAARPVQIQARGPGASGPTLIEQLAAYLDQAGVGVYAPADITGTIFLAVLPAQPVQAIAVAQYGGPESDARLGYDTPSIQIRVRGSDTDATGALRTAQRVYDVLHGLHDTVLPGGIWLVLCVGTQSGPVYIGRDETGHHEYTVNFRTEVRNTAGGRE